ncbi:uncharacterized protein LOC108603380 [Drosophila busckii]|uniref:uncharacterized protein LOC108603380 n=1 Tax=Drosophila busckii TaxID=30019 RepID=UPI00083F3584|nr:uncharacterized protein LOC108603380 [Drosophila busckii]
MACETLEKFECKHSKYDLVNAVKKYPVLWNCDYKKRKTLELRKESWQKVAQEMCTNFEMANTFEREEIVKAIQIRWARLRTDYMRHLKLSLEERSIPYPYEKELCFLVDDEQVENIAPEINRIKATTKGKKGTATAKHRRVEDDFFTQTNKKSRLPTENFLSELDALHINTTISSTAVGLDPGDLSLNSSINPYMFVNAVLDTTENHMHSVKHADPDEAFFNLLKPYMDRLSVDQKLDFQFKMLELLKALAPKVT